MMISFYLVDTVMQTILLVVSQLTMLLLAVMNIILIRNGFKPWKKMVGGVSLLLLNMVLYVAMQLNSRITEIGLKTPLLLPYGLLLVITLLSLAAAIRIILNTTRNRVAINNASIKEAFDNLPTGVCFFNADGIPVLCNRAMQRFGFAVCGMDVQYITDLERCLVEDFVPSNGIRKDGKIFQRGELVWQLEKRIVQDENGGQYTQFIALDVSDVYQNRMELMRENEQLRQVQENLQRLSANVVAVTREEEILNAKMRIHDEMGRCLVAAQKYLMENSGCGVPNSVAVSWQKTTAILKYNNETPDEDMLLQIRKTCEFLKLRFVEHGKLPAREDLAYLLTCAVRECVTNAVRYAEASALYATFTETQTQAQVIITNNGKPPRHEIREGGGLSTLRCRVERAGGVMQVQSFPIFQLTVTVPKGKEVDVL